MVRRAGFEGARVGSYEEKKMLGNPERVSRLVLEALVGGVTGFERNDHHPDRSRRQ
jgi:hypothetical protein